MKENLRLKPRPTRKINVGSIQIGGDAPISVQSMCATRTTDLDATLAQIKLLEKAGADLIRIAIDSKKDVQALKELRPQTEANLVVDLQENYRLAKDIAPYVQKIRYNPGHLHHHQREVSVSDKVKFLVDVAGENDCAMRIGVNFGSIDPALKGEAEDPMQAALNSAYQHCDLVEGLGFERFVVSLKSSDPLRVVEIYKEFAKNRPNIPLHLGVTEAGMLPDGAIKTRIAFEQLLSSGIGDTVRASLTLPDNEKFKEIEVATQIIEDVKAGKFRSVPKEFLEKGLNVISCPSCSRVENGAFVELAKQVKEATEFAREYEVTIAVMGCRVNGPGETDDADLGLWCGPTHVNLKRGTEKVGAFKYDEVMTHLMQQLDEIIATKTKKIAVG
ncbi:MAG: (E)-4-hydroxy-3-methylbut-2-enyl-diphosphate synthase [Deltaproteobacteria bacterium]|nr:(E)-4-hydroxy-3-methylbut-2-enyl-diphosphate synthase [Deltaproteobacteria bacterium]